MLCQGQQIQLTGSASFNPDSWEWYLQGQATPVATTQNYQASTPGIYILKASGSSCGTVESNSIELTTAVALSTPVFSSGPANLCAVTPATYSVNPVEGATSYTWMFPTDWTVVSGQGTATVHVISGNNTGSIAVRAVSACGESLAASMYITISRVPPLPEVSNQFTCEGKSVLLTVQNPKSGTTYIWFNSATAATPIAAGASFNTGVLTSTTQYYVQAENECGVSGRNEVTVNVSAAIRNNIIDGKQALCAGEIPASINGSIPTGGNGVYSYIWEISYDGINYMLAPGQNYVRTYSPGTISQSTWLRRKVLSGSCEHSYSNTILLSILPVPAAPVADRATACKDGVITLKVRNPDPKLTYRWYFIGHQNSVYGEGTSIQTVPVVQDTVYYVEAINEAGCVGPRTTVEVGLAEPFYDNTIGEPQTICAGEAAAELGGLAPKGGSMNFAYLWEASIDGINYSTAPGISSMKYYSPGLLAQTTWLRRNIVSESCPLLVSDPVKITVLPLPPKPSISKGATTLTASIAGVAYVWQKDGVVLPNATTQSIIIDAAGTYTVRVQKEGGCFSDFSDPLNVTPLPNAVTLDAAKAGIMVSPNPTTGKFILYTQQPLWQATIAVYNLAGKAVYSKRESIIERETEVDLADLPAGLYVLFVKAGQMQFSQRVVVVKWLSLNMVCDNHGYKMSLATDSI
ncbi:hypothetical protein GCM10027293_30990 [Pontibacter aydingkolensis]